VLVTTKSGVQRLSRDFVSSFCAIRLSIQELFCHSIEKFNLKPFGGGIGGPIKKNKTFFFVWRAKISAPRHSFYWPGAFIGHAHGDFSQDPFGNPVSGLSIVNPNMAGASTDPLQHPSIYFQCDSSGNTLPANADGSQASGTACNKIPSSLINPIGQAMINLYPAPNANNASAGINYVNQPIRQLDEPSSISAWTTLFLTETVSLAVSATTRRSPSYRRLTRIAEANAFGSNQRIRNHGRNIALGETHVFGANMVNQASLATTDLKLHHLAGTGTCISSTIGGGIPNANLGCASNKCLPPAPTAAGWFRLYFQGGYWALGDRGYSPFQGGTNIFSFRDSLDYIHNSTTSNSASTFALIK